MEQSKSRSVASCDESTAATPRIRWTVCAPTALSATSSSRRKACADASRVCEDACSLASSLRRLDVSFTACAAVQPAACDLSAAAVPIHLHPHAWPTQRSSHDWRAFSIATHRMDGSGIDARHVGHRGWGSASWHSRQTMWPVPHWSTLPAGTDQHTLHWKDSGSIATSDRARGDRGARAGSVASSKDATIM